MTRHQFLLLSSNQIPYVKFTNKKFAFYSISCIFPGGMLPNILKDTAFHVAQSSEPISDMKAPAIWRRIITMNETQGWIEGRGPPRLDPKND